MLNRKLTPILKGRTLTAIAQNGVVLSLDFSDDSILRIEKSADIMSCDWVGRTVSAVQQQGVTLQLVFSDQMIGVITL